MSTAVAVKPRRKIVRASEQCLVNCLNIITEGTAETLQDKRKSDAIGQIRGVLACENVVGVGVAEKITKRRNTKKLALTFYVTRKIPLKKLKREHVIPASLPESLSLNSKVKTDVVPIGKLFPEAYRTRLQIQPGYSIGHPLVTAGTLGAIVKKNGKHLFLSNSHVLANNGMAKVGDKILYPGRSDGGKLPDDVIGYLHDYKQFDIGSGYTNETDCAVAVPTDAALSRLKKEIKDVGLPTGVTSPRRGMEVIKVGRTTGKTTGTIVDTNFRFILKYPGIGPVGFKDQVLCSRYTAPGDSGSLVLEKKSGRAVGLHFAGATGGSVFSPFSFVKKSLGVKLLIRKKKARRTE